MDISVIFILIAVFLFFIFAATRAPNPEKKATKPQYNYRSVGTLFTPAERSFFGVLQNALDDQYVVMGKVRIADTILPEKGMTKSAWQTAFNKISCKHFDFVICDKSTLSVLAAVELDDKSHDSLQSQKRDELVNSACSSAQLSLIRFPAQRGYKIAEVRDKIQQALNLNISNAQYGELDKSLQSTNTSLDLTIPPH